MDWPFQLEILYNESAMQSVMHPLYPNQIYMKHIVLDRLINSQINDVKIKFIDQFK